MSSAPLSQKLDIFDCIAEMIPPEDGSLSPALFTRSEAIPLKNLLCNRIASEPSWSPLITDLLDSNLEIPDITMLLLARALFHENVAAVTVILSHWPWKELVVTYQPAVQEMKDSRIVAKISKVEELLVEAFVAVSLYKYDETPVELKVLQTVDVSGSSVYNNWLKMEVDMELRKVTQYSYNLTKVSSCPIVKPATRKAVTKSAVIDDSNLASNSNSENQQLQHELEAADSSNDVSLDEFSRTFAVKLRGGKVQEDEHRPKYLRIRDKRMGRGPPGRTNYKDTYKFESIEGKSHLFTVVVKSPDD